MSAPLPPGLPHPPFLEMPCQRALETPALARSGKEEQLTVKVQECGPFPRVLEHQLHLFFSRVYKGAPPFSLSVKGDDMVPT